MARKPKTHSKPAKAPDRTAGRRQQRRRQHMTDLGLVRRDVWAHPDDWDAIRKLERELMDARLGGSGQPDDDEG